MKSNYIFVERDMLDCLAQLDDNSDDDVSDEDQEITILYLLLKVHQCCS